MDYTNLTVEINQILFNHDLANTSCGFNEGMQDEYWTMAVCLVELVEEGIELTQFEILDLLSGLYGLSEDFFEESTIQTVFDEIQECIRGNND